jgi:hypothetical protein
MDGPGSGGPPLWMEMYLPISPYAASVSFLFPVFCDRMGDLSTLIDHSHSGCIDRSVDRSCIRFLLWSTRQTTPYDRCPERNTAMSLGFVLVFAPSAATCRGRTRTHLAAFSSARHRRRREGGQNEPRRDRHPVYVRTHAQHNTGMQYINRGVKRWIVPPAVLFTHAN